MPKRTWHLEVKRGRGNHPWRVRLVAANGEIVLTSEGYATRSNGVRAARQSSAMFGGLPIIDATTGLPIDGPSVSAACSTVARAVYR